MRLHGAGGTGNFWPGRLYACLCREELRRAVGSGVCWRTAPTTCIATAAAWAGDIGLASVDHYHITPIINDTHLDLACHKCSGKLSRFKIGGKVSLKAIKIIIEMSILLFPGRNVHLNSFCGRGTCHISQSNLRKNDDNLTAYITTTTSLSFKISGQFRDLIILKCKCFFYHARPNSLFCLNI